MRAVVPSVGLLLCLSHVRSAEAVEPSTGQVGFSPSGCAECDAFAGGDGFFAVAIDCLNATSERRLEYLRDEQWVSTQLGACFTALISSLGNARPASFFRQGLPAEMAGSLPGVVVGRNTGAAVTGAYALDAEYWSTARAERIEEPPVCPNEGSYAAQRTALTDPLCGTPREGAATLGDLNCGFSSLEVMAQQFEAYNRESKCDRSWSQTQVCDCVAPLPSAPAIVTRWTGVRGWSVGVVGPPPPSPTPPSPLTPTIK
jgi:hypothetical protein